MDYQVKTNKEQFDILDFEGLDPIEFPNLVDLASRKRSYLQEQIHR
jgi:hypothetical protein